MLAQSNPVHAALSFALVVLASCGLYLLLAAPFLMAATIIIYAGAIVVTFLFVLMLAQQEGPSDADTRSREPLLATVTGFLLLGALVYVIQTSYGGREIDRLLARIRQAQARATREEVLAVIGNPGTDEDLFKDSRILLRSRGWLDLDTRAERIEMASATDDLDKLKETLSDLAALAEEARGRLAALQPPAHTPLSDLSGPSSATDPTNLRRDDEGRPVLPAENSAYLGRSLFTDFLLPVELGGTLLLVATVGAIAIAHRSSRRQADTGRGT
jgi:NADH-quinone oxidoreductase subunit J